MRSTTQAALAFAGALAATIAVAQRRQTLRLRGVIEKVDGHTVLAKLTKGDEIKLNLADSVLVVGVVKASVADIKEGEFIGSGAIPQPDGSQKAIEVHIYAESMRGTAEGSRPWEGAPNGTMTNGRSVPASPASTGRSLLSGTRTARKKSSSHRTCRL